MDVKAVKTVSKKQGFGVAVYIFHHEMHKIPFSEHC